MKATRKREPELYALKDGDTFDIYLFRGLDELPPPCDRGENERVVRLVEADSPVAKAERDVVKAALAFNHDISLSTSVHSGACADPLLDACDRLLAARKKAKR